MDINQLNYYYNKFKFGEDNFHNLMKFRVREILLISTFYDAFTFEQESRLSQQIVGEYHLLNLTTIPRITSVPTGEEALNKLKSKKYDLVITTMRIGNDSPFSLSAKMKEIYPELPILLLLTVKSDIGLIERNRDKMTHIDNFFLWNGDSKLFLAMIKYIEDKMNVQYDTEMGLVRVILVVEDSVTFYSIYLPLLYTEIMNQTQKLITQELNDVQKYFRMRARPKVLLTDNFEEAIQICNKYKQNLLSVISDVTYFKGRKVDETAGLKLIKKLKSDNWDVNFLLQSSDMRHKKMADQMNIHFIHKFSPTLLNELSQFMVSELGFGDFVFRDPQQNEITRARTSNEMEEKLLTIPIESILYHNNKNHFSAWLIAHGDFQIAKRIRPLKTSDFPDPEANRGFLINVFKSVNKEKRKGKIIDFNLDDLEEEDQVIRLANGSLGGKGRGIAFLNSLLTTIELEKKFHNTHIRIPLTAIIGTNEYDHFVESNHLLEVLELEDDEEIKKCFVKGKLSDHIVSRLREFLKIIKTPLAIRSSGLLEDSQSQPFAGIYQTYMIPNNHESLDIRLKQLTNAVKLVFASPFLTEAKNYIKRLNYRIEEEKMAVVIQEVVGNTYGERFYPHISGVAQSYNYYPISYMKHNDGIALVAVGLGQTVVEGERNFRFCPSYPEIMFAPQEDLFKFNQNNFYAIDISQKESDLLKNDRVTLVQKEISAAEEDGTLFHLASVWDQENNRIIEGITRPGIRIVNFANILKYDYFPLAGILTDFLDIAETAFGVPVEIEFAVNLYTDIPRIYPTFYLLQVRPLTILSEEVNIDINQYPQEKRLLYTEKGMGHGINNQLYDIILLDPQLFDNTKTFEMQKEVAYFNEKMKAANRDYILIGPGRWGTRDPFLGIPVQWGQISCAKVIIEAGLKDFDIEPSQGTHFFHNLVAMNIGYFNIPYQSSDSFLDYDWLAGCSSSEDGHFFHHYHFDQPLKVIMDGKKGISVILKPGT
ncbi:MAG: hypothetical protein MJB14_23290 [Spirochaetes bacterium]|nr:hypothetical protein [Spirochaetota bacterium]